MCDPSYVTRLYGEAHKLVLISQHEFLLTGRIKYLSDGVPWHSLAQALQVLDERESINQTGTNGISSGQLHVSCWAVSGHVFTCVTAFLVKSSSQQRAGVLSWTKRNSGTTWT